MEQLKVVSYLATSTISLCVIARLAHISWFLENPEPSEGHPSVFLLGEAAHMLQLPGVKSARFNACKFGAESAKPTMVI